MMVCICTERYKLFRTFSRTNKISRNFLSQILKKESHIFISWSCYLVVKLCMADPYYVGHYIIERY